MHELFQKYRDIIQNYQIEIWESEPAAYRFKSKIILTDGSVLFVKDYLLPSGRKYAYHWQGVDGKLIIRWDNAPHWKNIATYPHHKHITSVKHVEESVEVFLDDVLEVIREKL